MTRLILGLSMVLSLFCSVVQAATYGQSLSFGPYFTGGQLAASAKVYHYAAGTLTTKTCWSDREKVTPVADPLVLDSQGVGAMFCDGIYKFVVKTTGGSTLYTFDYVAVSDQTQTLVGEGAALTAASTLVLGTDGDFFHVGGTTTITMLSGTQSQVTLVFDAITTLTHSGTLILTNATNYTTAAGTVLRLVNEGGGVWRELFRALPFPLPLGANGTVLAADSTAAGGTAWSVSGFTTGDVKLTLKTAADTGWILMNDLTIGDASSSATGRANADTSALYTVIWTNVTDQWAPVTGGRGASAAADFAAHKPMMLPKTLGRALAGYGTGTVAESGTTTEVDLTGDTLTVASNNTKWITGMPVVFTLASGTITGLTSSTTYYVIRSSATLIQLASSLVNAQNGTAINLTAKSSPVWTITHTYTARVLGERAGEEAHAMSSTELLSHDHGINMEGLANSAGAFATATNAAGVNSDVTRATGGNAAMNIMQPTVFLNVMVKL